MNNRLALLAAALVLGLVPAACGGDDNGSDDGGGGGGGSPESAPSGTSGDRSGEVSMKDTSFQPANLKTKAGGTVKWVNDDSFGHDVTGTGGPGGKFKSGAPGGMQNGDTFEHKFTKPGTVQYVCTVHSNMKGNIEIE